VVSDVAHRLFIFIFFCLLVKNTLWFFFVKWDEARATIIMHIHLSWYFLQIYCFNVNIIQKKRIEVKLKISFYLNDFEKFFYCIINLLSDKVGLLDFFMAANFYITIKTLWNLLSIFDVMVFMHLIQLKSKLNLYYLIFIDLCIMN